MKRRGGVSHRRWHFFLVGRCTRLVTAIGHALQRQRFSGEKFGDVSLRSDHAERQSSEWIARLNADDVSYEDLVRFEAWRDSHKEHADAFERIYSTWVMLKTLKGEIDSCYFSEQTTTVPSGFNARLHEAKPQLDS